MLVEFTIEGCASICAPYDDCIDIVLAARANGKTVVVRKITLEYFEAYHSSIADDPRR